MNLSKTDSGDLIYSSIIDTLSSSQTVYTSETLLKINVTSND